MKEFMETFMSFSIPLLAFSQVKDDRQKILSIMINKILIKLYSLHV